jgi:rSAM/selenodomain-associated transferase 1
MNTHSLTDGERLRQVVIVFAKAPVAGVVKTRLIPRVGVDLACRLHEAFVQDTLGSLSEYEFELHTDVPAPGWQTPHRVSKIQITGDLGHRMYHALETALSEAHTTAMILGSDSPTLPVAYIRDILANPADVCLGPAVDGGFYAISCRKVAATMFDGVTWSAPETRAQTVEAVQAAGLAVDLGPEWYDVDCGDDLDRLARDPGLREASREVLTVAGLLPPSRPSAAKTE